MKPDYSFKDRQLILITRDWPQGRNLRDLRGTWLSNAECVCVCGERGWGLLVNSNLDTSLAMTQELRPSQPHGRALGAPLPLRSRTQLSAVCERALGADALYIIPVNRRA